MSAVYYVLLAGGVYMAYKITHPTISFDATLKVDDNPNDLIVEDKPEYKNIKVNPATGEITLVNDPNKNPDGASTIYPPPGKDYPHWISQTQARIKEIKTKMYSFGGVQDPTLVAKLKKEEEYLRKLQKDFLASKGGDISAIIGEKAKNLLYSVLNG